MPWTLLSSRLANLPLVLCGPMIRRVEKDSISIWVALKSSATVNLSIFASATDSSAAIQGTASTRQFGQHFHVALVTAKGGPLDDGKIYYYDMDFGSGQTLNQSGVLSNTGSGLDKIVYPGEARPSFVTPPSDTNDLRIAQASCRKAHGGDTDGMVGLHLVVGNEITQAADRPQQLFLTGDQIYAEELSHVMLYQAMDASETLLGWSNPEPLPDNPPAHKLRVGSREELLADDEGFTGDTENHLIRLGEFYAMYLMTWSQELWDTEFPSYEIVVPHLPAQIAQYPIFSSSGHTVESDAHRSYRKLYKPLQRFVEQLPATRRLLANIATYTAYDDHEVTDDWFIDGVWTEDNVKNGKVTKRVLQNALCAYAVFQAWGNTPDEYLAGQRLQLLDKLEAINIHQGATASDWTEVAGLIVPRVVESGGDVVRTNPGIRFDYRIDFPTHRVLILDTRMARSFPERDFFLLRWIKALLQLIFGGVWIPGAALISEQDFPDQLPDSSTKTALQDGQVFNLIVSPAPIFGHWLVEEIVRPRLGAVARYFVDYEDWSLNRGAFQEVLRRLSHYSPAVVLAGDVHYSLTALMQYWDHRDSTTKKGVVAQLCCSSAKNSDGMTNLVDWRALNPDDVADYFAWNAAGDHIRVLDGGEPSLRHVSAQPNVHKLSSLESLADPDSPTWRYRIRFGADQRTSERGIVAPTMPGHARNQLASQHRLRAGGSKRMVVGRDNASIISFDWTRQEVRHEIWFALDPDDDHELVRPYTVHTLSLAEPPDSERPGDP